MAGTTGGCLRASPAGLCPPAALTRAGRFEHAHHLGKTAGAHEGKRRVALAAMSFSRAASSPLCAAACNGPNCAVSLGVGATGKADAAVLARPMQQASSTCRSQQIHLPKPVGGNARLVRR